MNIAFICTEKLPVPPVLGGAIQIYIDNILPIISKEHHITVFTVLKGGLPEHEKVGNVTFIRVKGRTKSEYIKEVENKISLIHDKLDLIHVFNRPRWVRQLSRVAPDTYFSLSLHNEMMLPKKINPPQAKECIDKVEFITTVSKFIGHEVINMYPSAKGKVFPVYSAADINIYHPVGSKKALENKKELLKKHNIEDHKVVICVSRLSPKKGQQIVMEAMKIVMESHPKTALVLVGSKWYGSDEIDEFTSMLHGKANELKGPVIFTGFLTPDEVPKLYNIADIFVCASQWREPLARIHYEGMAAGLPIITTNRGGNSELFEQNVNGIVLDDYDNPIAMAEKINYLLDHEDQAKAMGKKARKDAEENYTFQRVSKQLLSLFNKVKKHHNIKR
ncbi:glycosyltransferase family 4 protein [Vallitalea guaymasensis]|uniref:glycosyltransferase family 4 protein n=1 Tax=Vallitalea guaymasensis TaxID=1185412 RepID=UPI00272D670E|nr:glycosyltransferase family 4 protein [Vallitalea guaymasensis]